MSQTVAPDIDPGEKPGERPYEMVWARRVEPGPPSLRFDDLRGWRMEVAGGAEAELRPSRAQNVWGRAVGRLRYRAAHGSAAPRVVITLPNPVAIGDGADSVDMWVWGNRWEWVNPPDTPPLNLSLRLRDADAREFQIPVGPIRWEEWWLMHRRLPAGLRFPLRLEGLEFTGGTQTDWQTIYLDSVRFYREQTAPLKFAPRPRRNLALFAGQSPGGNTGPGQLPFPTREQTILPMQLAGKHTATVTGSQASGYAFQYTGTDCALTYRFRPERGLASVIAAVNGKPVGSLLDGAAVTTSDAAATPRLLRSALRAGVVSAAYDDGTTLTLRLWQKSLVVDVINTTGKATGLAFGQMSGLTDPRTVYVPTITSGVVLLSKAGPRTVYTSLWPDWYRSNGSELYGAEQSGKDTARINGGVRYIAKTDGVRNPLYERVFITVSPSFEEVLPVIANPVGLHAKEAVDRLWQESWGPDDYAKQAKRSEMLRAYGIDRLIQCNHEITWRDNGESFTLRTRAAPGKGGDEALQRYIRHQRGLGWYSGLYTNYTDFAPVNEHWTPDAVQRQPDGEWRAAWPRCYAEKPMAAVQFDAVLAPQVKQKYGTNSAYTDVSTAVAPWGYCDYDARVPGAATFAQTFYCHGELLRNDSRVYGGPIFSEGTYQWLYAGLADGNYGHTYNGHNFATDPLLPVFDLYQIHTKECDIGVSWTAYFCDTIPNWHAPENLDRAIDRFLLTTLAYGHIGWLVEEEHGIARTSRSYYMLQQVQAHYGLQAPTRIAYWDGRSLRSVSAAIALDLPRTRRQLHVEYPSGLRLWLNDHPTEDWTVRIGSRTFALPPAGWLAWQGGPGTGGARLLSYSALAGGRKVDYLRSAAYTYLDGRGQWFAAPEAASNGGLAIRPAGPNRLQIIRVSGEGEFAIKRPYGVRGVLARCEAFDVGGTRLPAPRVADGGGESWIEPVKDAVRYELTFSGKRTWRVEPARTEAAPGAWVPLRVTGKQQEGWDTGSTRVRQNQLFVPETAKPGEWVRAWARAGGERREVRVRVVSPVEWRWRASPAGDATRLALTPEWRLAGLVDAPLSVLVEAPAGWDATPSRVGPFAPASPPRDVVLTLRSSAPVGTVGALRLSLADKDGTRISTTEIPLACVEQNPQVADLAGGVAAWGLAMRGKAETLDTAGTGAVCYPDNAMQVGGAARRGLFMHPPYVGGTGYTWAETGPVDLPTAPCRFRSWVGIRDGGDPSDGVSFLVEVVDAQGVRHRVAERTGVNREWRLLEADLSPWAGQRIRLRLVADVGPADNSTADWASWGEPAVVLAQPAVVTEVR